MQNLRFFNEKTTPIGLELEETFREEKADPFLGMKNPLSWKNYLDINKSDRSKLL